MYPRSLQNLENPFQINKFFKLLSFSFIILASCLGQNLTAYDCSSSAPITPFVLCSNITDCNYGGEFCNIGSCPGPQRVCWYDYSPSKFRNE